MRAHRWSGGFSLIEILIVVALIALLSAIVIPNMFRAQNRSKYSRAAAEAKTAVSQALTYANEKGVYPSTLQVLREAGYASISDLDPWGTAFVLASRLTSGSRPAMEDDIYVYTAAARARPGPTSPGSPTLAPVVPQAILRCTEASSDNDRHPGARIADGSLCGSCEN